MTGDDKNETVMADHYNQCYGSGSGIRCFFGPRIRDREGNKSGFGPGMNIQIIFPRA
jgi:hypothetical protein